MSNLIEQLKDILDDGGTFPQVKTIFYLESKVKVNKGCLASIFRQLFRNAIEAMRRSRITPEEQEVKIHFRTCRHEETIYCEILFYNSGTQFLQSILDWGGLTFKTSNLEGGHSGLGLYIVERLLQSIHSPLLERNRHFELLNLKTGAQVKFCLPIIAESDSN
jgi:signal transduction histidine kinase